MKSRADYTSVNPVLCTVVSGKNARLVLIGIPITQEFMQVWGQKFCKDSMVLCITQFTVSACTANVKTTYKQR